MTSLLSSYLERWVARKKRVRSESPTATDLQSSFTQLEQLILLSASPVAELEPPGEAVDSSPPDLIGDVFPLRDWAVSSTAMMYDDAGGSSDGNEAVFDIPGMHGFSGENGDYLGVSHTEALELTSGTIAMSFTSEDVFGRHALFSKDFTGNRDGGDLTAFVENGRLKVRFQSADAEVWLKTAEGSIEQGQEHHVAFTFGEDGAWLYLDGEMKDWELDFTQDLASNTQDIAIGANTWSRNADNPDKTWDHFDGQIRDFMIFDTQYDLNQVATLAGNPPAPPLTEPTVIDGVLYGADQDETLDAAAHGVTEVQAGYGDDVVIGTNRADVLAGGHGEDRLEGGEGDDLLVSYADGREPEIAQNYDRADDPDNEIDPNTNTYYSEQPIEGDDVMIGGAGADTFYFRTLINAKRDIILKHVNDDGTINWGMNGVAGENDNVHDHWVERIGDEVIWDFNRAEGDSILIEGHTTEVYKLEHVDTDNDGILNASVLHIWSNQGNNGGAHNKDLLGSVTVFGDLVMESDYTVNKTDYGIVRTISELDEAVTPRVYTSVGDTPTPAPTPEVDDGELPNGGVFGMLQEIDFSGEDHIEVTHSADMELSDGTIAMTFTADDVFGYHALFSKDFSGNRDGGDLTAFVVDGRLKVRFQSADDEVWLYTEQGSIQQGQEYDLAITFGSNGFGIYLDGEAVAWNSEFTQGLSANTQNMAIGANTWSRNEADPYCTWNHFDGRISDFVIYDGQVNPLDVMAGTVNEE